MKQTGHLSALADAGFKSDWLGLTCCQEENRQGPAPGNGRRISAVFAAIHFRPERAKVSKAVNFSETSVAWTVAAAWRWRRLQRQYLPVGNRMGDTKSQQHCLQYKYNIETRHRLI